jgi:UDP-N-acetylmuramoylalanine--D-glutamate ligase
MTDVRGKRVLVVGLARTGRATARCLQRHGAQVTVTDSRPPYELRADVAELLALKIGMELGLHREATFLAQDLIVVSPGVAPELPELQAARAQGIPVVSEVEVASWFLEAEILGITGSNGKTTTTALLGKMLESSRFRTFVGGNIGLPLIAAVDQVPKDSKVVTELSSFQLEATQSFRPHVAVLLNITPNHLDRHPTLEAYVAAKAQIFRHQTPEDLAILNADDPAVMALAATISARKIFFSRAQDLPDGVFVADGQVCYRTGNLERALFGTREIALRGDFNVENVLAATAAACVVGADFEAIARAVREFRAVEHRLEFAREIRGVEFFNDSKATSVDATAKALSAFGRGVHLILGGKDKGAPYAPLRPLLKERARTAYLIGAAAKRIERELMGAVELIPCGDLETAMRRAFARAIAGDSVVLSPACSSFDQFQDYEHRGRVFKEIVQRLAVEAETTEHARRLEEGARILTVASSPEPAPAEPPSGEESAVEFAEPPPSAVGIELPEPQPEVEPPVVAAPITKDLVASESAGVEAGTAGVTSAAEPVGIDAGEPTVPAQEVVPEGEGDRIPVEVKRPELVYVYEVDAEESVYDDSDNPPEPPENGVAEVVAADELPPSEVLEDEALPFEVRVGAPSPASAAGRGPGAGLNSAASSGEESSEESPPGGMKPQTRLPGL